MLCILFLIITGVISHKITSSYAFFSDEITSEKTIKISVRRKTIVEVIKEKNGTDGIEKIIHNSNDTLQIGATENIEEYRYQGKNPNNYIMFNDEEYRIIGVIPTDDGTGNIEERLKIIKSDSYGIYKWDTSGSNNWARPASLNTEFNNTYYNSISQSYKNLISNTKYFLGGYNARLNITPNAAYEYERKISGNTYYYNLNPTNWIGKIALMSMSDYGYAANETCSNATMLSEYGTNNCPNNNWLFSGNLEWLLSQTASISTTVYRISDTGYVYSYYDDSYGNKYGVANVEYDVRPVFHLNSDVYYIDGDGTKENKYKILK